MASKIANIPLSMAANQWEQRNKKKIADAADIKLCGFQPPINALDDALATFENCEKINLSSNQIERLVNFDSLKKLKILSIGQNQLKSLDGVECLARSLEQLWASYNMIESLAPVASLKKLKVLFVANNKIKNPSEINHISILKDLTELIFIGNPLQVALEGEYRRTIAKQCLRLKKLDSAVLNRPPGEFVEPGGGEQDLPPEDVAEPPPPPEPEPEPEIEEPEPPPPPPPEVEEPPPQPPEEEIAPLEEDTGPSVASEE